MRTYDALPSNCRRWQWHSARGVTLLELLIVIALLLAMAAMVGPTVLSTLNERAFNTTMDVTGRQMMLARAHAQASGRPVEVVYVNDAAAPSQVVARLFRVSEGEEHEKLVQSWAQRTLPQGFSMSDHLPRSQMARVGGVDDAPVEAVMLRLGVFLPDGSAMAGSPRWLSDGDGRVSRMNVNPYTGHVEFTRLPPEDLREATAGDDAMEWDMP